MKCPTCNRPDLTRNDFYWRRSNPTERTHHNCKKCECERQKVRNNKKSEYRNDFLAAYFN